MKHPSEELFDLFDYSCLQDKLVKNEMACKRF